MEELITETELARFEQADAEGGDAVFERHMKDYEIDWEDEEVRRIPVLAHYYVKGQEMHYYVLARVHDEEDDLLTCVNVNQGVRQLILFPVRLFNGAVLDEKTQEHAFAEEKLFGTVCLGDLLGKRRGKEC